MPRLTESELGKKTRNASTVRETLGITLEELQKLLEDYQIKDGTKLTVDQQLEALQALRTMKAQEEGDAATADLDGEILTPVEVTVPPAPALRSRSTPPVANSPSRSTPVSRSFRGANAPPRAPTSPADWPRTTGWS
jgi:hypothetical protein